jgi:hypothetical protein
LSSWKKEEPEKPSPTFGCPTVGELVSLYAELSEPVNHKAFQKIVDSAADREHNIFVEVRSKGKLVGFLRAWFDPPSGRGVVYEIVVSPERRREHIAKSLLHFLITKKLGDWKGDSRRVTANLDRHLAVVRTMYAVALTFGFQRVVEGSYLQFLRHFSKTLPNDRALPQLSGPITLLLALLFVGLGLLGIRLFWATGNIRRFLLRQTILLNPAKTTSVLFLHFPVLLLHAVLFFFCVVFSTISAGTDCTKPMFTGWYGCT